MQEQTGLGQRVRLSAALGLLISLVLVLTWESPTNATTPSFQLSGTVLYHGDSSRPVPATAMVLRDELGNETVTYTDSAGYYEFDSFGTLDGWATPWVLTPERRLRYEERGNTISSLDAGFALQMAVGTLSPPTGIARVGCDVTGDGTVSSLDASRILQNKVGFDVPLARCPGEWAFAPISSTGTPAALFGFSETTCDKGRAELETAGGSLPNATVDFAGAAFGDCSANWRPSSRSAPWVVEFVPPLGSHFTYGAVTRAVAIDQQENVIVAGETIGDVDIAGILASDPYGIFIVKLTKFGDPLWSVVWPRPVAGSVQDVAADPSGDIVVTGIQQGTTFYADGSLISPDGTDQVYVAKLSGEDGSPLWAKAFGSAAQERPGGIAATDSGNIVVGMGFSGTLDVGGGERVANGTSDGLVMALSSSGQFLWDRTMKGPGYGKVAAVRVSGDRIVVAGMFDQTLEIESSQLASAGAYDAFVLELDASGALLESMRLGGAGYEYVEDVARNESGELVVVGSTSGSDFPEPKATETPEDDAFVAVVSNDGSVAWGRRLGAGYIDTGYGVAFDAAGDVIVGGRFGLTVDFGGVSLTSLGQYDGFIAKYEGDSGALQWAERIGGSGLTNLDWVEAVTASDQGIYFGGQFNTEYTWTGLNEGFNGNRAGFVRRVDP